MYIKIISEGTPKSTKVLTEDGAEIRGIQSIDFHIQHDDVGVAKASIVLAGLVTDANGESQMIHPKTGLMTRVKSIQFYDGSDVTF